MMSSDGPSPLGVWRGDCSPLGLHRVIEPIGVLPQQAWRLDPDPAPWPDEVVIEVERLQLDATSFRQLLEDHGEGAPLRRVVTEIVRQRGKMHNPTTGSGGMLLGTVREVGPASRLGLHRGDRVATLVSLTLTPLEISDGLVDWDGRTAQVPCRGTAVLFGRSNAARLPADLPDAVALGVLDVCGAPALVRRVVERKTVALGRPPALCVFGAAGRSGSLSLAAGRCAGAARTVALVPTEAQAGIVRDMGLGCEVVVADARDPVAVAHVVGEQVDVTVVCVDVTGCEHGALLATADGGTVVFFSMGTSFSAAALGAEGLVADVELIIGTGYVPGHAELALNLVRTVPALRPIFDHR